MDGQIEEKKIELRKLTAKDLFLLSTILSKIGFKEFRDVFQSDSIKSLVANAKDADKDSTSLIVGANIVFEIAGIVLSNLEKCEDDIFRFLASVTNKTVKEIAELDPATLLELIIDVIKNPQFKDFFKVASKFVK